MIEIVWEFVVKDEVRGRFELAYGPGGAWSKLFKRCPGFRGTTMLRDTKNPRRFLTIDLWNTEVQMEQALVEHRIEYADMMATFGEWSESMTEVGMFSVLAEATVRPRPRSRQNRAGETRRSRRQTTP